ncbi:hypothetical protein [Halalkalibacter urbisdiaboli]|uniref:hypothetical protein n=1 Tax=Halalkalibacter urbisdiaboli TaxID=1960589 RepID=UPI0013FD3FC5|nr:hypothetical protein [Halalkalibacter urbisdiaboli]
MKDLAIKIGEEVEHKLEEIAKHKGVSVEDAATLVITQYSDRYLSVVQRYENVRKTAK